MEVIITNEKKPRFQAGDLFRWQGDIIQIVQVNMLEYMFITLNTGDRWDDDRFQITAIPQKKLDELTYIGRAGSMRVTLL